MLSSGGPVKNKEDFQELDEVMQGIAVKWVSNCGPRCNCTCDTFTMMD